MSYKWAVALVTIACCTVIGQSRQSSAQPQNRPGLPKGQVPTLGRPTTAADPVPVFNFDQYFLGKWTFDGWDVPDTILGPGGTFVGSTVYKHLDGMFYQADTEATGPERLKLTEIFAYHKDNKVVARQVTDSRGFGFLQVGPIGGDLGGYFNVHFESQPFAYKGKTVRMRTWMRLLSPVQYKNEITISVDEGRPMNYGIAWWRKEVK